MRVQSKNANGFTIVELLIVVIVIAILATITVVAFSNIRQRAVSSAQLSELSQLQKKIQVDVLNDTGATMTIGMPVASVIGPGSSPLSAPVQNGQRLTLYGVFDTFNNPGVAAWANIIGFMSLEDNNANNNFRLRNTNSSHAGGWFATSVVTNQEMGHSGIMNTTRRHIGWMTAEPGTISSGYNNATGVSRTLATHTGWNFETLTVAPENSAFKGVAALAFAEHHDAATRERMVGWLNKQYNVGL